MRAELEKKVRKVRRCCGANVLLSQLGLALGLAGGVAALAVAAQRVFCVTLVRGWSAGALLGAATAATILLWLLKRPSRMQAAVLLDERLATRERFSTALAMAGSDDPFARAAIREAHQVAERVDLRRQFPVRPTRRWLATSGTWAAALALLAFLPQMDLLGYLAKQKQQDQAKQQLAQAHADVRKAASQVTAAVSRIGDPELAEKVAGLDAPEAAKPAELRREAISKLGDLSEKLQQMTADERFAANEALKQTLKGLRSSPKALTAELDHALARGDFAQAAELLKDLQNRLAESKLSPADQQALKEQLKDVGRQLGELSRRRKALEDTLKEAGLSGSMAGLSEEELRKALEKAGLSAEQIAKLMDAARACDAAKDLANSLAQALIAAAEAGEQLSPEELAKLIAELEKLELTELALAELKAAMGQIRAAIALLGQGQAGAGPFSEGLSLRQGPGTGGPGKGYGPRRTGEEEPTKQTQTLARTPAKSGEAIASRYIQGSQVKGESRRDLVQVVRAARDRAAEAISDNEIPRRYESSVKKYFGELEGASRSEDSPSDGSAPSGSAP